MAAMRRRRLQLGGRASMVLMAMALAACSVIGHEKVAGWPALEVVEHHVPNAEMRTRCAKYVGFGMSPDACAEFDFVRKRCDLWFSADFPPPKAFIEHERMHCQGYDHVGETNMRDFLAGYNARRAITLVRSPTEESVR